LTASSISVLLADDHSAIRAGLRMILESAGGFTVAGEAADGAAAVAMARALRPDVVLMDIRMPGRDGIAATADIADAGLAAVLILTTFDIDDYVFRALEAGVSGFLLKDSDPDEILRAVRHIADGHGTLDHTLTRRIVDEYVQRRRLQPVTATRATETLTARERDILLLLAQGMSNEQIAGELFVEVATVKSHLARLLPKLGVQSRLQAAVWAYQNRVVAVDPPPSH